MTTHTVFLTQDAMNDLEAIHDYIFEHDSPDKAAYVVDKIEETFESLSLFPERGGYPQELLMVGIKEYREVFSNRIGSSIEYKTKKCTSC